MRTNGLARAARLTAVLLAVACADAALEPQDARPQADLWGPVGALLACSPLPADSITSVVGPEGGILRVGPHVLRIPAGALNEPVAITAVAPSDTVNRVVLSPHGLVLDPPARLILSYANCGVVRWLLPKRVAYTTDDLVILDLLASLDNPLARRVSADLEHFSTYAVAW